MKRGGGEGGSGGVSLSHTHKRLRDKFLPSGSRPACFLAGKRKEKMAQNYKLQISEANLPFATLAKGKKIFPSFSGSSFNGQKGAWDFGG